MGLESRFNVLYFPKSINVLIFICVLHVQPLECRYASAGGLLRVKATFMSAGNKCPATVFANCRDKSSDLQTNKWGVWVRGDAVDFRLWNSEMILDSLLETLEFHFQ